jgi:hypothetical protein
MMKALGIFSVLGLMACSFFMPKDQLQPQAAYDLHCPANQLEFTPLGGDCDKKLANDYDCTLGVRGCGQQATYLHVRETNTWVMNTTTVTSTQTTSGTAPK